MVKIRIHKTDKSKNKIFDRKKYDINYYRKQLKDLYKKYRKTKGRRSYARSRNQKANVKDEEKIKNLIARILTLEQYILGMKQNEKEINKDYNVNNNLAIQYIINNAEEIKNQSMLRIGYLTHELNETKDLLNRTTREIRKK